MQQTYQILVVEDEELAADRMEMLIEKAGHELIQVVDNSTDALAILKTQTPDLVLMDINIEGDYDGIELADLIHAQAPIPIIFITSLHDERTFRRIARTNPLGYIVKPFSDIQLQRTIDLVFQQLQQQEPSDSYQISEQTDTQTLFVRKGKMLEKIKLSDILYLEADGRYCWIVLPDNKYLVRIPMKDMLQKLTGLEFLQVHRSFIVNTKKIDKINLEEYVILIGENHIPLSRREKESVLKKLDLLL